MATPFTADQPFKENNVINESERDSGTPANDVGKLAQLEADGEFSPDFMSVRPLQVDEFTADGTWTKPDRGSIAIVEIVGAGGGGAAALGSQFRSARGGGGGAYRKLFISLEKLNSTEPVVIGVGGDGASRTTSGESDGGNGGNTTFSGLIANGGGGGEGQINSTSMPSPANGAGGAEDSFGEAGNDGDSASKIFSGVGGRGVTSTKDESSSGVVAGLTSKFFTSTGGGGHGSHTGSATTTTPGTKGGGGGGAAADSGTATSGAGGDGYVRVTVF